VNVQLAEPTGGTLQVYLLGPPEVRWDDQPLVIRRRLPRALLYHLAAHLRPVPREQLCFLFWPDIPDATARRNLTIQLTHLRRALPDPQVLVTANSQVRLDPDRVWSDVVAFEALSAVREPYPRVKSLQQAADLYRGSFLAGFSLTGTPEFETWASQEGYRLERVYLETLSVLIEEHPARGEYEAAIACAQRYLATDDLAEEVHRRLIELYATSGDRSAAVRQFKHCAAVLERELGVEPLPETRVVYEAALKGTLQPAVAPAIELPWATLPGLDAQLVGRDADLDRLKGAYARAQGGQGGVFLISGEAGIGKSRLMQEFATRLQGQALILTGAGYCDAQTMPYQPIVEAFRSAFDAQMVDSDPSTSLTRLSHTRPIWLAEASRLLPELRDMHPDLPALVEVEPKQARARLFEALSQLTLSMAAGPYPVLLCLDDIHWADGTTLDWLAYLGRKLHGSRLLVIGTYRSQEADALTELRRSLTRLGVVSDLKLGVLDREAVLTALRHLYGDESSVEALANRLQRATGGNPFFLMETLRALIEGGQRPEDLDSVDDLPLSETVRETVAVRLGRLSPVARQVLEAGAILGPTFRFATVSQTAGRREMETLDGLDELVSRQLLVEEDTYYRFLHDIIRVSVHGDLSHGRRRLLHRRAGEALERTQPDQAPAQLARHFEEAGVAEKAAGYWRQAGDMATGIYAAEEAIEYYSRALAQVPGTDLAARCELLLDRERLHHLLGNREAQWDDLDMLATLARALDDAGRLAELALRKADYFEATGDYPAAISAAQQAVAHAGEAGHSECIVRGHLVWGQALRRQGDYDLGRDHWAKALDLASAADLPDWAAKSLAALALFEYDRDEYSAAQGFLEQGLAIIRETGDLQAEGDMLNTLGTVADAMGDYSASRIAYQQALATSQEIGNRLGEGYVLNNLGQVANNLGAYQEAREYYEGSLAIFYEIGNRLGQGAVLNNLGETAHDQGDYHGARGYYERALATFREIGNRPFEGYPLTGLGDALAGLGDLNEAAAAYQQAIALRQELGQEVLAMTSRAGLAEVRLAQGDLVKAQGHITPILEHLHGGGSLEKPVRIYLACYLVLETGQDPRAGEILEAAHRLLQERAVAIPDEQSRRSFLEKIPSHCQIVALRKAAIEAE
jgi:predicted ATPase/DNA-binding SARP family transcriptional activator